MDEYHYIGINFREDPNIPLPPGTTYGDIGMSKFFKYFIILLLYRKTKIFLDDVKY
jgi:hypothetical protein